jgi:glycosyltransferase involved in cell wall biosynthesis
VVCPWLSLANKGSLEVDGVKVVRYWPPMTNSLWIWPFNRLFRFFYIKQTQRSVLKIVKNHGVDLVYVYQARETGYAVARIKERLGVPFFFRQITAWDWHFKRSVAEVFGKKSWYQKIKHFNLNGIFDPLLEYLLDQKSQVRFAKEIYSKADKIIFLSQAAIKESQALNLDASKTATLGIAIEEDLFKPMPNKKALREKLGLPDDKIILFIGRLSFAEKGLGFLLEAMPLIIKEIKNVKLVVIGGGGEEVRMRQLIEKLNISDHTLPVGRKSFSDLPDYINAADVFVVPSVWMEAFGQVTIEAMSCGLPVVTSDAGASPEINIDSQTGFVVPAANSEKIANAVIKILKNESLQAQLGSAARQRVLENYTYQAITNKFLEIINKK